LKYGIAAVAVLILTAVGVFLWQHCTRARPLTDKDVLVLADFANTTGDPVFDGNLYIVSLVIIVSLVYSQLRSSQRMIGFPALESISIAVARV
jgi:hypothetical protein